MTAIAAITHPSSEVSQGNHREGCRVLPPAEHKQWDEFAMACENGTLFQTTWWYRAWGIEPVVHALTDDNGKIEAGICFGIARQWGTKGFIRLPFTPRNGPVFAPLQGSSRHSRNTHAKKMLLAVIHSFPRLGAYDLILPPGNQDLLPFLWNGFDTPIRYTYVIPCSEQGTWMKQASKTQQWSIRRAAREAQEHGYTMDDNPAIGDVLALLKETADYKSFEFDVSTDRLAAWWHEVAQKSAGRAYLLRNGDCRPAAATLMVFDRRCAYYVGAGMRRDLRKGSLVNVLLLHRMIEESHRLGIDFDFEGSILPGVERFFRSFGAELRPVYRVVKFRSPIAYAIWYGYRYLTRHRTKWVWHD